MDQFWERLYLSQLIRNMVRRTARTDILQILGLAFDIWLNWWEKIDVAVPEGEIRARKMELPSHAQWMPCWDGELLNCWILKHEWLQLQGVSLCWCKPLSSMGRPPCWCWSWLRICRGAFSDDQVGQHGVYLWKQTRRWQIDITSWQEVLISRCRFDDPLDAVAVHAGGGLHWHDL